MHHNLIIKDGDTTKVVKEVLVDGIQFVDEKPRAGSTNPVTSDGVASGISQSMRDFEEVMYADQEIPESTLRFSFGDLNYDPTQDTAVASRHNTADRAGGGTPAGYGGTWTKLRTKYTNIWDYTYADDTLLNEFDNGNFTYEATPATRFWNDVENNPIKIIASNTAGCTSFKRFVQGVHALTEVWELDTSDATDAALIFSSCLNLKKIPRTLNFAKLETSSTLAMFQFDWNLEEIHELVFPDSDELSLSFQNMFQLCFKLKSIDNPLNLKSCVKLLAAFNGCINLNNLILENTQRITNCNGAFISCGKLPLSTFLSIDTSNVTNFGYMFANNINFVSSGHTVVHIPPQEMQFDDIVDYDYSNANQIDHMYYTDMSLKHLDATKFSLLKTGCNVNGLFYGCRNVETGILDTYNVLVSRNPSNHTDCFLNCGIDTPTGRAELEQIPTSWGGLAES